MEININGESEILDEKTSINKFLKKKGKSSDRVIVVYNGQLLDRKKWSEIILEDQDDLEVLRFVGGG